jgi:hypothetical protein
VAGGGWAAGMNGRQLRGEPPMTRTPRQVDVLAGFVEAGASVSQAAASVGIRPSTAAWAPRLRVNAQLAG